MRSKFRLFALVFAATFSLGLIVFTTFGHGIGDDFRVLWKASYQPLGEIYRADPHGPFVYPPTAILWLKPLSLFSFWTAFGLWTVASVICFWRAARSSWLMFLSPAAVQCVIFGQTSLLIASLVLLSPQGIILGAMCGLAFSIKPQVVWLAPLVFLVRRDFQALIGFALTLVAAINVTIATYGPDIWVQWLRAIPAFKDTIIARDLFWVFITPGGMAQSFGLPFLPFWAIGAAFALLAVFVSRTSDARLSIVGSSLLGAPYAAAHDMVALIPFALAASSRPFPALSFAGILPPISIAGWLVGSGLKRDDPSTERFYEDESEPKGRPFSIRLGSRSKPV